jgi:gamma-glutamyl-gamma-aminobutyrate hydrolase PuuD
VEQNGSGRAPVVGLTSYREQARYWYWDHPAALLPQSYIDVVVAAGGAPVLLPPEPAAAPAVDVLDALVLTGGSDIDPRHYGADPHPRTGPPRPERDVTELAALHHALRRGIPVLGVCRGAQLLNVALGGTLHQHLPDAVGHDRHGAHPPMFGPIEVALAPGTVAESVLGATARVRCLHHQAIDRLGDGLVVSGRADDGTVEAVELAGHPFVVGVQWHPEQDTKDLRLVQALVTAAAASVAARAAGTDLVRARTAEIRGGVGA